MATSFTSATEVLDLRHFRARQLRALLGAEADLWETSLRWNYRASTDLLLQYIDSEVLTGFVALRHGTVAGFTFAVFESGKAVIGDAFSLAPPETPSLSLGRPSHQPASPSSPASLAITRQLLIHLIELLRATPMLDRIEAQLLLYDAGVLDDSFRQEGFTLFPRLFLELDMSTAASLVRPVDGSNPTQTLAGRNLSLRRWLPGDYQAAAELIHAAYEGHVDARINDQYRSLHGSLRFLHNIVRFPGCGVFEAQHSWVIEEPRGRLVAMILCSRVHDDVAHITQLCVLPSLRRRSYGRLLLRHCAAELARAGFHAITLTVTESNTRAVTLYQSSGFHLRHRFDATVLELRTPS